MRIAIKALILVSFFYTIVEAAESETKNPAVLYPERYIKITEWSFYSARGVGIIHHVTIENTSDIAYKNIKVRVHYYSESYSNTGTQVGGETGVLPVLIPPHTKRTYLEGGTVLGAGSSNFYAGDIEVLEAIPVINES